VVFGLTCTLEAPYCASFRKPTSTSFLATYNVIPFTTLRGLVANALGYRRADLSLQEEIELGVRPETQAPACREMVKLLKFTGRGQRAAGSLYGYPSSPMYREFLVYPTYKAFIVGEDEGLIEEIGRRLADPKRPLYIGQSDDMVAISSIELFPALARKTVEQSHAVVDQILPNCQLTRLPLAYEADKRIEYSPALSIAESYPVRLNEQESLWDFGGEYVKTF
jgi:CRISPR-associated protein Cas5h